MYCSNILLHGCSATIQTSTIINEHYQNESSVKEVQALGNKTPPMTIYCASKSLAEKVFFLSWSPPSACMFLIASCLEVLQAENSTDEMGFGGY